MLIRIGVPSIMATTFGNSSKVFLSVFQFSGVCQKISWGTYTEWRIGNILVLSNCYINENNEVKQLSFIKDADIYKPLNKRIFDIPLDLKDKKGRVLIEYIDGNSKIISFKSVGL